MEDRTRIDSMQSYGPVWENSLQKDWTNVTMTVQDIADKLGISHLTLTRHAIRLKLPMNTLESRSVSKNIIKRFENYRKPRQDALLDYRLNWMTIRKENPDDSRQQLMDKANFLYLWLRKNDSEWLESNLPPVQTFKRRIQRVDWKSNDRKLSAAVKEAAHSIKSLKGRPIRASLAAVIRKVGHCGWIESYREQLPRTVKAIEESIESPEDFSIRRVEWATNFYLQKGIQPTRHHLIRTAGIMTRAGKTLQVQNAVDDEMKRLNAAFR